MLHITLLSGKYGGCMHFAYIYFLEDGGKGKKETKCRCSSYTLSIFEPLSRPPERNISLDKKATDDSCISEKERVMNVRTNPLCGSTYWTTNSKRKKKKKLEYEECLLTTFKEVKSVIHNFRDIHKAFYKYHLSTKPNRNIRKKQ